MGNGSCATRKLTKEEDEDAREIVNNYRLRRHHADKPFNVPVYWHSVRIDGKGDNDDQITASIKVLNDSFGGKFTFTLIEKLVTSDDKHWNIDFNKDRKLKSARKGECNALNVYSTKLRGGFMGYATYPPTCGFGKRDDGVVIAYGTVPGGDDAPFNLGNTLTHEVGHWLYLAHTFENGCSEYGDGVDDTPAVRDANFGCVEGTDSCPGGGIDLIENFMDYTDDECMESFTAGQLERAEAAWEKYRAQDDEPVSKPVSEPVSEPVSQPVAQPVAQPSSVDCTELTKQECKKEDSCVYGNKKKIPGECVLKNKYNKADCAERSEEDCETESKNNKFGVCELVDDICFEKCEIAEGNDCKKVKGDFKNKKICKSEKIANPCWKCQQVSTTCGP